MVKYSFHRTIASFLARSAESLLLSAVCLFVAILYYACCHIAAKMCSCLVCLQKELSYCQLDTDSQTKDVQHLCHPVFKFGISENSQHKMQPSRWNRCSSASLDSCPIFQGEALVEGSNWSLSVRVVYFGTPAITKIRLHENPYYLSIVSTSQIFGWIFSTQTPRKFQKNRKKIFLDVHFSPETIFYTNPILEGR